MIPLDSNWPQPIKVVLNDGEKILCDPEIVEEFPDQLLRETISIERLAKIPKLNPDKLEITFSHGNLIVKLETMQELKMPIARTVLDTGQTVIAFVLAKDDDKTKLVTGTIYLFDKRWSIIEGKRNNNPNFRSWNWMVDCSEKGIIEHPMMNNVGEEGFKRFADLLDGKSVEQYFSAHSWKIATPEMLQSKALTEEDKEVNFVGFDDLSYEEEILKVFPQDPKDPFMTFVGRVRLLKIPMLPMESIGTWDPHKGVKIDLKRLINEKQPCAWTTGKDGAPYIGIVVHEIFDEKFVVSESRRNPVVEIVHLWNSKWHADNHQINSILKPGDTALNERDFKKIADLLDGKSILRAGTDQKWAMVTPEFIRKYLSTH